MEKIRRNIDNRSNNQIINNIEEVSIIRPILIILLVLYHAFAPWCGAWKKFEGFCENDVYWWLAKLSYSFMLPMFVFISGYVWAFQRECLKKHDSFLYFIKKKFKRLYIPSLIFSILYFLIFDSNLLYENEQSWINIINKIVAGYAHMWFLPMLYWLFVLSFFC